ncbi:MAG: hypothetical protein RXN31_01865 [Candidatus Nanopusillus acidilobi]
MARSQLYLYTIVVLLLILFYFVSNLDLLDKEFQFYSDTYPQYGEIYKLLYGNDIFENILNLYGSTLIPFTVYYNCSYNIIQVPNYFNSTHVIVVDNVYDFLPSYAANNFVAFEIIDNYSISSSSTGYCIFNGYEVYNPYFNNQFEGTGNLSYYIIFYPQSIFTINDNYLNNLYNLEENVIFQYLNNYKCIAGEIKSLSVQKMLNSISVNFLNISNAQLNNNIISVNITNNDICPIDLNNIYYDNYNIPSFENNFNTSSNNSLIYPGQQIVGYYQYNNDDLYFCLESLGNEICTPINNLSIQYYVPITLYNSQPIPTPEPFQQDIAICNGSINIGNNFAYINNVTLFNQINSNGQNVMFFNPNNGQLFYSWYEGQLTSGNTYCDVWWVNIPNGVPSNGNLVIYMAIGSYNTNYYSQYYPYVGAPIQVLGTSQYDNGQKVFNYYQNFGGLSSLPSNWAYVCGNQYSVSFSTNYTIIPPTTSIGYNDGITTIVNFTMQNNILEIYASIPTTSGTMWDIIDLGVGGTNPPTGNTYFGNGGGIVSGSNSYGAAFSYNNIGTAGKFNLFVGTSNVGSTTYNYAPTIYEIGFSSSYTYFLVNYTQILSTTKIPGSFSLPITIAQQESGNNIYLYWVLLRSLPPNGIMPSISTGSESSWPP